MNTRHTARAVAFVFAVFVTFVTMAAVNGLAAHEHAGHDGALWAAAQSSAQGA